MSLNHLDYDKYCSYLQKEVKGKRISKLVLVKPGCYLFSLSDKRQLLISAENGKPFIGLCSNKSISTKTDSPFAALLRKSISNSEIVDIKTMNEDRIIQMILIGLNDVYEVTKYDLILEAIPACPNLILVSSKKILGSQHVSPLESDRPICKGLSYVSPLKKESNKTLICKDFDLIDKEINTLIEEVFSNGNKQNHKELFSLIKRKAKSSSTKIKAIEEDIKKAKGHLKDIEIGNAILCCEDFSSAASLYLGNGPIKIDGKLSLAKNAEKYFLSFKKAKKVLNAGQANLEAAKKEKEEFEGLEAFFTDLDEEVINELEEKYLKKRNKKKPVFSSSLLPRRIICNNVSYLLGRNAKGNDYLVFKLTKNPSFIWMHLKDEHSSHLIIQKENPSEKEIEIGAEILLFANNKKDGDVIYSKKGLLKKGSLVGEALLGKYESAHIREVSPLVQKLFDK